MKCDELKDYDIMDVEAYDDKRLEESKSGKIQVTRVYMKHDVDAAISELKDKIAEEREFGLNRAKSADHEIGTLCEEITNLRVENARLVKCCKEYDSRQRIDERIKFNATKQLRATKRSLLMARANAAKNKARFFGWSFDVYNTMLLINIDGHKYKMPKQSRMMTCHDWIEIFERVEERCRQKAKEYK